MKILHTSDWHLGKYLDKYSRLEEQKMFIDELEEICEKENIDLIIIAGDIYDCINPPILAEKLFFNAMKRLSLNDKRPIIIISGNHDSANRLIAPKPFADEFGIILQAELSTIAVVGDYGNFKIVKSGEGFFEIEINNEKAVFLTLPYPTEKMLNEVIFKGDTEQEHQKNFSDKIKEILNNLSANFRKDTINIIISHLFIKGGIETDTERKIQAIGGAYAVDASVFPKNTTYVALGHLHKMQKVKANCLAYYSGSPLKYSKAEVNYKKGVIVLETFADKEPVLKKIYLKEYKPIKVFKCKSYEQALEMCELNKDTESYVFIEILSEKNLTNLQMQALRETKKDIINIFVKATENEEFIYGIDEEKTILEQFEQFYIDKTNLKPTEELLDTFLNILTKIESEEESLDEAANA